MLWLHGSNIASCMHLCIVAKVIHSSVDKNHSELLGYKYINCIIIS